MFLKTNLFLFKLHMVIVHSYVKILKSGDQFGNKPWAPWAPWAKPRFSSRSLSSCRLCLAAPVPSTPNLGPRWAEDSREKWKDIWIHGKKMVENGGHLSFQEFVQDKLLSDHEFMCDVSYGFPPNNDIIWGRLKVPQFLSSPTAKPCDCKFHAHSEKIPRYHVVGKQSS